jgi:hypothetical protein
LVANFDVFDGDIMFAIKANAPPGGWLEKICQLSDGSKAPLFLTANGNIEILD